MLLTFAYFGGISVLCPARGAPSCGLRGDRASEGGVVDTRDEAEVRSVGSVDFSTRLLSGHVT